MSKTEGVVTCKIKHLQSIYVHGIAAGSRRSKTFLEVFCKCFILHVTTVLLRLLLLLLYRCSSALYVRLVFDDVVLWRSYFRRHMTYLEPGIDACIRQLLERTELKHGRLLVSHAFAYITVSKEGLTESELEDVLSLDEQVGALFLSFS